MEGVVKSGLLFRKEDPANRRRQLLSLTAGGRNKVDTINELCDRYYEGFLSGLPERAVTEIAHALQVFVEAMREWRRSQNKTSCCGAKAEDTL